MFSSWNNFILLDPFCNIHFFFLFLRMAPAFSSCSFYGIDTISSVIHTAGLFLYAHAHDQGMRLVHSNAPPYHILYLLFSFSRMRRSCKLSMATGGAHFHHHITTAYLFFWALIHLLHTASYLSTH